MSLTEYGVTQIRNMIESGCHDSFIDARIDPSSAAWIMGG